MVLSTKWFLDGDVNQSTIILNENQLEDTLFTVFLAFFYKGNSGQPGRSGQDGRTVSNLPPVCKISEFIFH